MREIKFRAWDKKNKKMISHEKLFSIDCSNEFPFLPLLKNMYSENLDVEIMQYTGMHDSTGKEIYEGDIIHCYDEANRVVEWVQDNESWELQMLPNGDYIDPLFFDDFEECDVIGNRCDNPELLGGAHDEH